jgi:hypothetical protein
VAAIGISKDVVLRGTVTLEVEDLLETEKCPTDVLNSMSKAMSTRTVNESVSKTTHKISLNTIPTQ